MSSENALEHDHQHWSVCWMACFSYSISAGLFHVKHGLRKQRTHNKLHQHLLSTWLILLCGWRCETFHKLLCRVPLELTACLHNPYSSLPPLWLYSLWEISRSQSDQQKAHISHSLLVWLHKVTAAATGNLGCKSTDGDPIKCALDL